MKMLKSIIFMSVGVTLVLCLSLGGFAKQARAEIHPNVTEIVGFEWGGTVVGLAYLITGKETAIIDTGRLPVAAYIGPALEELGMELTDIDYILDTSWHGIHTIANYELQEASGAKVCIHKSVADYLEDPELAFLEMLDPAALSILSANQYANIWNQHVIYRPPAPLVNRPLKEGDVVKLGQGMKLRVLHLPGHEIGDTGYYLKNKRILFAGGSVRRIRDQFPGGVLPSICDMDAYEQTIERIKAMKLNQLIMFHPGASITIDTTNRLVGDEIDIYLGEILESIEIMREAAETIAEGGTFIPDPEHFWASYDEFVGLLPEEWGMKPSNPNPDRKPFIAGYTFLNLMNKVLDERR